MKIKSSSKSRALVAHDNDNVATALNSIPKANRLALLREDGFTSEVTAIEDIPLGHKIATKRISRGEKVIKYGEVIGVATEDISLGSHVHVHNVNSLRGKK